MTNRYKYIIFAVSCAIFLFATAIFPQTTLPAPKQEKLLNGLKVLMWSDPKADKVSVKIRIHSGSAFDPQGKEGLMQMLADNLFPNESTREFFKEDLGGDLEVITNYDYIQVNASSSRENFLTMLETIATSVSATAIDKDTTTKLRSALLARVESLEADASYVADQAVAKRLFGTFPYGRPQYGTADSIKKIESGDLIDAKNRFLTADNATMVISGNFDKASAFRAVRRYLGGWLKADKKVPATFRQPDEASSETLTMRLSANGTAARYAFRGVARGEKDFGPAQVFARILQHRLRTRSASPNNASITVKNFSYALTGIVTIGLPVDLVVNDPSFLGSPSIVRNQLNFIAKYLSDPITTADFETAKDAARSEWNGRDISLFWLDSDTYKFAEPDSDRRLMDSVRVADVTAYAEKARKNQLVSVLFSAVPQIK